MRLRILAAGKPALAHARLGVDEYLTRLKRLTRCELVHVRAGSSEAVSAELLQRSTGNYRIALDERGDALTTGDWAERFAALEMRGEIKSVAFLIGAADGHTDSLRDQCDRVWSLSTLTLQHELALVVLLEQLYRVASLRNGEPYHR